MYMKSNLTEIENHNRMFSYYPSANMHQFQCWMQLFWRKGLK